MSNKTYVLGNKSNEIATRDLAFELGVVEGIERAIKKVEEE
jgi:hypothetical protein